MKLKIAFYLSIHFITSAILPLILLVLSFAPIPVQALPKEIPPARFRCHARFAAAVRLNNFSIAPNTTLWGKPHLSEPGAAETVHDACAGEIRSTLTGVPDWGTGLAIKQACEHFLAGDRIQCEPVR